MRINTDMNSLFTIVFVVSAYRGANPIVHAVNPCGSGKSNCRNGQCISQSEVCDFVPSCTDGSDERNCGLCDFEHSPCGWTDISSGQFRWQRRNGSMTPLENGPPHDVTYGTSGTGNYMMVVPRKGNETYFDEAKLLSPVFGNLAATCTLQFARFEVTGSHGITHVYLIPPGASPTDFDKRILLWIGYSGFQYKAWTVAQIVIGRRRPGYRLLFAARTEDSDAIGTAIDAVHFMNCSLGIPTGRCLATQFTCKRGSCIDRGLLCDFSDDCGDNSDEEDSICTRYTNRCDFEEDMCNLAKDNDAENFNWGIESGDVGQGPWSDHTYGTPSGSFLYISATVPWVDTARVRLKSPVFQASTTGNCRLRFFYYRLAVDSYQLNVYTASSEIGPLTLVWKQAGRQVESWIRVDITLTSAVPFRVMIEGEKISRYAGDNLAVDDLSFTPECEVITAGTLPPVATTPFAACGAGKLPCDNCKCISSSLFCNFRADCSDDSDESRCPALVDFEAGSLQPWTNDFSHNAFNWTVGLHGNSTPYTGPRIDHTTGTSSGRYAIVKANISDVHDCQSYLISPLYNQAGKTCRFTFWYSVQGLICNTTNVYMRSGGTDHWLMSFGGSWASVHKDPWRFAEAVLPVCASSFQIVVETICAGLNTPVFTYKTGSVAIDDLKFVNCSYPPPPSTPCAPGEHRCGSGHCISSDFLCDFQADCCDGSDEAEATCQGYNRCDFEYGMCGWSQTRTSQLDWHRGRGGEPQYWPRAQDHTSGSSSGHFLHVTSRRKIPGQLAALVSNLLQPKGECIMSFWYHQHGSNSTELNVYINTSDKGRMPLVKLYPVEQRKPWDRFWVTLNSPTPFQVIIEWIAGDVFSPGFIIAIDDVSFTPGCGVPGATKPTVPTKPPENCTTDQFRCLSDKSCLDHGSVCDFLKDCQDGSDEIHCGTSCDFEANVTCGWRSVLPESARWRLVTGSSQVGVGPGPKIDNTTGTGKGRYLLVDNPSGTSTQDTVIFESHLYRESSATCTVLFAYSIDGGLRGTTLSFLVKTSQGQMKTLWSADDSNGSLQTWRTVQISVGAFHHFALLIKVKLPLGSVAAVAIDDISLLNCAPAVSPAPLGFPCADNTSFTCNASRQCLPTSWVCDGLLDCHDGSDETTDCAPSTSTPDIVTTHPLSTVNRSTETTYPPSIVHGTTSETNQSSVTTSPSGATNQSTSTTSSTATTNHVSRTQSVRTTHAARQTTETPSPSPTNPSTFSTKTVHGNLSTITSQSAHSVTSTTDTTRSSKSVNPTTDTTRSSKSVNPTTDTTRSSMSVNPTTGSKSHASSTYHSTTSNNSQHITTHSPAVNQSLTTTNDSQLVTTHSAAVNQSLTTTAASRVTKQVNMSTGSSPVTVHSRVTTNPSPVNTVVLETTTVTNQSSVTTSPSGATNRSSSTTPSTTAHSHRKPIKTSPVNTASTSVTNQHGALCPSSHFKCSTSEVCVPGLLLCDGVADCADKSDELHCPRCQANQYYCSQTDRCSITNATRCDGVDDCGDNSDESLCTGACPAHYCQQGASCVPGTKTPQCGCTDSYHGNRCQYKTARQQGSEKHSSSGWKVGLGVGAGVLSLVLVAVAVFLVIRKRKLTISRHSDVGLNNPVFDDYGTDRLS